MALRILPAGLVSIHHVYFLSFITFVMTTAADVGFVDACQICIRNSVATNIPISFRHSISLESFPTEIEHQVEASRVVLSNVEYLGRQISFIPLRRRRYPPLFMMFNSDGSNETSAVDPSDTVEAANNRTNFDSVTFFDDLQRSGDNRTTDDKDQEENTILSS